jgi:hypothetical protein
MDNAGNASSLVPPSFTFTYDASSPTANIGFPVAPYYQTSLLTTLSGTAADRQPLNGGVPSGVTQPTEVFLTLYDKNTAEWYTGSGNNWTAAGQTSFNPSYDGANWSFNLAAQGVTLANNTTYTLSVQVVDKAGNWTIPGTTITFAGDNSAASVSISTPGNSLSLPGFQGTYPSYRTTGFASIKGTASDGNGFAVGVTSISIQKLFPLPASCYNGGWGAACPVVTNPSDANWLQASAGYN